MKKDLQFKSLKEGDIDTTTPAGRLVFSIFSSLSEFERDTIRQWQAEGIALAKDRGEYKGKVKKVMNNKEFQKLFNS